MAAASGDVFDSLAGARRVLRVNTIAQLFTAARVLAAKYRARHPAGDCHQRHRPRRAGR